MASKDSAEGVEAAEVMPAPDILRPEGQRIEEDEHGNAPQMPAPPQGKSGSWVPVQVADDPAAHYAHESVWVEHRGHNNGAWQQGELYKFVEDEA